MSVSIGLIDIVSRKDICLVHPKQRRN